MKRLSLILLTGFWFGGPLDAQVPDAAPVAPAPRRSPAPSSSTAPANNSSSAPALPGNSSLLGKDLPFFNPGTEILEWDGKHWNINNQRIFEARFEKYLNAPAETSEEDKAYQQLISAILQKLAPENDSNDNLIQAWAMLPRASQYSTDAGLCNSLAEAVYSVWAVRREQSRLTAANEELYRTMSIERAKHYGESRVGPNLTESSKKTNAPAAVTPDLPSLSILKVTEAGTKLAANRVKGEALNIQVKIEFQALLVQLFLQRRYQHVIMGTQFYRRLFGDGDTALKVGKDTQDMFSKGTGMPPTIGTLDSVTMEAMHDVAESVDVFKFLLEKNEIESATKRLAEAFVIGEHMPEIRTLPRDMKRQALEFTQKSNRLISALDVRDYALAETILNDLEATAKDFDPSQPRAAIETAKTISKMHLAKAKNAAVSGDRETLEAELREATTIWPRNPALAEVSGLIFSQADMQQKAIADLEQLLSQKNYRQIYDDKMRFIAASALYPERQEQLKTVLENMQVIEGAIARANEIAKRGDYAGAWEGVERTSQQFPDDPKLNQLRANLTTEAAEFVRCIRTAQQLEKKDQTGSSLAWYLKAQKLYPPSEFAQEGILRLVQTILPSS